MGELNNEMNMIMNMSRFPTKRLHIKKRVNEYPHQYKPSKIMIDILMS